MFPATSGRARRPSHGPHRDRGRPYYPRRATLLLPPEGPPHSRRRVSSPLGVDRGGRHPAPNLKHSAGSRPAGSTTHRVRAPRRDHPRRDRRRRLPSPALRLSFIWGSTRGLSLRQRNRRAVPSLRSTRRPRLRLRRDPRGPLRSRGPQAILAASGGDAGDRCHPHRRDRRGRAGRRATHHGPPAPSLGVRSAPRPTSRQSSGSASSSSPSRTSASPSWNTACRSSGRDPSHRGRAPDP